MSGKGNPVTETAMATTLLGSACLGAAVTAAGLWLYTDYKLSRHQELQRRKNRAVRRFLHNQREAFTRRRDEVIAFASDPEMLDTKLSRDEVYAVYGAMKPLLSGQECGRIPKDDFMKVLAEAGVAGEHVAAGQYRVWDANRDGFVSFHELVRGLGVLAHGSGKEKLSFFFDAYDLDGSGFLDREELTEIYHALCPGASEEQIARKVRDVLHALDANHNSVICREEFYALGEHRELVSGLDSESGPAAAVTRKLLARFGLGQ